MFVMNGLSFDWKHLYDFQVRFFIFWNFFPHSYFIGWFFFTLVQLYLVVGAFLKKMENNIQKNEKKREKIKCESKMAKVFAVCNWNTNERAILCESQTQHNFIEVQKSSNLFTFALALSLFFVHTYSCNRSLSYSFFPFCPLIYHYFRSIGFCLDSS